MKMTQTRTRSPVPVKVNAPLKRRGDEWLVTTDMFRPKWGTFCKNADETDEGALYENEKRTRRNVREMYQKCTRNERIYRSRENDLE
jgi:hypothetical protein